MRHHVFSYKCTPLAPGRVNNLKISDEMMKLEFDPENTTIL